jgi:hypothetical protein
MCATLDGSVALTCINMAKVSQSIEYIRDLSYKTVGYLLPNVCHSVCVRNVINTYAPRYPSSRDSRHEFQSPAELSLVCNRTYTDDTIRCIAC